MQVRSERWSSVSKNSIWTFIKSKKNSSQDNSNDSDIKTFQCLKLGWNLLENKFVFPFKWVNVYVVKRNKITTTNSNLTPFKASWVVKDVAKSYFWRGMRRSQMCSNSWSTLTCSKKQQWMPQWTLFEST